MSWFTTLQAQSWFSGVANDFASLAPDVAPSLWEGELLAEDSTLNPAQQDYKNSGHWGLFQEDSSFPTTVGLPPATLQQLQDPNYNATVAALAMETAIKNSGATTLEGQIEALEKAGWPGTVSAGETATRVADVQQVAAAQGTTIAPTSGMPGSIGGLVAGGGLAGVIPGIGALIQGKGWNAANQAAQQANSSAQLSQSISTGLSSLEENLLVGGIIIAGISGGFLLLANSMGAKPVPVPV